MAKTKSPFFSMGSRGTILDTLTTQKRGGSTLLRTKPTPTYRQTLPQLYQRWLYQDYAYLWTKQSDATKALYHTNGRPYHLTGFQYWMKVHLNTMPDILGWWRLDEIAGSAAIDFSPYAHNGLIVGASPTTGVIARGKHFDGINDRITLANPSHLINLTTFSCIFFFNSPGFTGSDRFMVDFCQHHATGGFSIWLMAGSNGIIQKGKNTLGTTFDIRTYPPPNQNHCLGLSWDGTTVSTFLNGVQNVDTDPLTGTLACSGWPIALGMKDNSQWYNGMLDNFIMLNRALDATEHLRWAERRYPL